MSRLNIDKSTYGEIEKQLGILTNEGLNELLEQLTQIAHNRLNAGLVLHKELLQIVSLFELLDIEREIGFGNTLTITNYADINRAVFNNQANEKEIEYWLLRGMLENVAEIIDEGFRYGMENSEETMLLRSFLFYLTSIRIRLITKNR